MIGYADLQTLNLTLAQVIIITRIASDFDVNMSPLFMVGDAAAFHARPRKTFHAECSWGDRLASFRGDNNNNNNNKCLN